MKPPILSTLGLIFGLLPSVFGQVGPPNCTVGGVIPAPGFTVRVVAGGGPPNGAVATSIAVSNVSGVAADSAGNLYLASQNQHRVFRVATNGTVTTVAGTGSAGYFGDNGPAVAAQLNCPSSVAVDGSGNVYIAEPGNYRIRKVSGGIISTIVGTGVYGYSGDGGPAAGAQISQVSGIAVDSAGNLYIADSSNARIRRVSGGVISTVAGNGTFGFFGDGGAATSAQVGYVSSIAIDTAGNNFFFYDNSANRIRKVSAGIITTVVGNGFIGYAGDGGLATNASLGNVGGLAVDGGGNLYLADNNANRVRKVSAGVITAVAGNGNYGYSGDGGAATSAQFFNLGALAVDGGGGLFLVDQGNYRIRKVSGGVINTVAGNGSFEYSGDGGAATDAQLDAGPIALTGTGDLYVGDSQDDRLRKVSGGSIATVAQSGFALSGVAVDAAGNPYYADSISVRKVSGGGNTLVAGSGTYGYSGDGGPATSAQLAQVGGVAVDNSGTVYISDQVNGRIRKISGGVISMVAGGGPADGVSATSISVSAQKTAVDSAGNVYVTSQNRVYKMAVNGTISTVAGNGTAGYSGDNGPATMAQIQYPSGVAVDATGNVYIGDSGNCRIRKVSGGQISTVAGNGNCSYDGDGGLAVVASISVNAVAVDNAGNLYIGDPNNRVRKVSSGVITTVAGTGTNGFFGDGGPAVNAQLAYPQDVAVDSAGNLYIADTNNSRIRKVSGGVITTIAGNGTPGFAGDGGVAVNAQLQFPQGVAVDSVGNVYLSDAGTRIRKVSGGVITTIAGTGSYGFFGDGGLATGAGFASPQGVAVDNAGNVFIADSGNFRVRKVSGGFINSIAGNGYYANSGDGGPAVNAQLGSPSSLAVDSSGNLYISDSGSSRVRMISPGGTITTFAGGGGETGDGGLATNASLGLPRGIAVDATHNVYIADSGSLRLRKVSAAGVISTITTLAGISSYALSGDGGVAVDSAGKIYLADATSGRILQIAPGTILQIGKSHLTNFTQGQNGATYTLTVLNSGIIATAGTVTVTETIPTGLTLVSMSGSGWTCVANVCTRSNALAPNSLYPPITVTVNVSPTAPALVTNQASVSGGGAPDAIASDPTIVTTNPCQITLSPTSGTAPSGGGTGSVGVTTATGCPWTAVSNAAWLVVTSQSTVTGSGTFSYSAAANPNGTPRAAVITAGATNFTLTQQPAGGISALRFVPVTPCRIADTRSPDGPFGGPALGGGVSRDFVISLSACGIPAAAIAYSLNFTVVPLGPFGFLSVWPAGQTQPGVSTLNSLDGRIRANAAIVPAGVNGAITLYASDPTHVIMDINGYFVPATGNQNLAYYPITPCRLVDTRGGAGPFGGPALPASSGRDFPVLSGSCGIPAGAQAYAFNMTVVPTSPLGFLSTWPAGTPQPLSSTLNALTGAITSNMAIVPAGIAGAISVFATQTTHLIIDIAGYFAPPGSAGALDFYIATPCRIADTRGATGPFGGPTMSAAATRIFDVPNSACSPPASAKAFSLNATVVPPAALGFLTLWGTGGRPTVSTLNSLDGAIVANAALVPAGTSGWVTAYTSDTSHLILDINGYFQ